MLGLIISPKGVEHLVVLGNDVPNVYFLMGLSKLLGDIFLCINLEFVQLSIDHMVVNVESAKLV